MTGTIDERLKAAGTAAVGLNGTAFQFWSVEGFLKGIAARGLMVVEIGEPSATSGDPDGSPVSSEERMNSVASLAKWYSQNWADASKERDAALAKLAAITEHEAVMAAINAYDHEADCDNYSGAMPAALAAAVASMEQGVT